MLTWTALTLAPVAGGAADQALLNISASRQLTASDVLPAILQFKISTEAGFPPPYFVQQEKVFERPVLAAEEIVLYPGSKLILAGSQQEKYIIARKITVIPGDGPPPVLTWQRPPANSVAPPGVGKAPAGLAGGGDGAPGGPGANGSIGNSGFSGQSAPTIYLVIGEISGGVINFELRGQDGGPGGQGQEGGDGGPGMSGNQASLGLFDCKRGAGNGGPGGRGGDGGSGGPGGKGGNGGNLILLAASDRVEQLGSKVRADVTPGNHGNGGQGGGAGAGGPGGAGGAQALPYCVGEGRRGDRGSNGQPGAPAIPGTSGQKGATALVPLSAENINAIRLQ